MTALFLLVTLVAAADPAGVDADSVFISLDQVLAGVSSDNLRLQAAFARLAGGQAELRAARGEWIPDLSISGEYTWLDLVPQNKKPFIGDSPHDFLTTVGVRQPLYDGGRAAARYRSARARITQDSAGLSAEAMAVRFEAQRLYRRLQGLRQETAVLEHSRDNMTARLKRTRLLQAAGRLSALDLGRLEVEAAGLDNRLIAARNQFAAASRSLAALLGRSDSAVLVPVDSLAAETAGFALPGPDDARRLIDESPELAQRAADVEQARAGVTSARAALLPSVDGAAWYGWEFGPDSFSLQKNDRYYAGVRAAIPLLDGGTARNRLSSADASLRAARLRREDTELRLQAEVANGLAALQEYPERIAVQRRAVEQARANLRTADLEYSAGRRSATDAIQIQQSLLESELTLAGLYEGYHNARARLLALLGLL
ncbi:MAG: TolC family protein [bacterium]